MVLYNTRTESSLNESLRKIVSDICIKQLRETAGMKMNNRDKIIEKFGYDPYNIRETDNYVDWYERGAAEKKYGSIIVIKIGEKWYRLEEYLDCTSGTFPEHEYRYNRKKDEWYLVAKSKTPKQKQDEADAYEEGKKRGDRVAVKIGVLLSLAKRFSDIWDMCFNAGIQRKVLEEMNLLGEEQIKQADEDTQEEIRCILRMSGIQIEKDERDANWRAVGYLLAVKDGMKKKSARQYADGFNHGAKMVFYHLSLLMSSKKYDEMYEYLFAPGK